MGAFLERHGALIALLLLLLVGSLISEHFRRPLNLINIVRQNSFVGITALGMTFVIVLGGIDLSIGSMVAFLGGLAVLAMERVAGADPAASPLPAILTAIGVCLAGGGLLGFLNGVLIAKGRIAPFIATLGGMAAFRSLAIVLADGGEYRVPPSVSSAYNSLGSGGVTVPFVQVAEDTPLTLHFPVLVFLGMALLGDLLLNRTVFGAGVRSIGDNEKAARYCAIRVNRVRTLVYVLSGITAGVTALLLSSRMSSVSSSQTGTLLELDAIAAVVVGGTRMQGGSGRIWGTVIGVLILGVINNLLNMISSDTLRSWGMQNVNMTHLQGLIKGVIIIAAVLLQRTRRGND